jgi:hypothetical protein
MTNNKKFRAFMGYQTGDFDNAPAIYTDSADFLTEEEANTWILSMYDADLGFECSTIELLVQDSDLAQIEEYEQQEQMRFELGIPKNLY